MIKSTLKLAARVFLKEKQYVFINLLGLAIGVASCLIIGRYVIGELSYDQHHPDNEKIYRVNQTNIWSPEGGVMGSSVLPLAAALKNEFPQISATLRVNTAYSKEIRLPNNSEVFIEPDVIGADSTFFDFFGFNLKEGDPKRALAEINSVVLSANAANKYFGDDSAIGKTLLYGWDKKPLVVTGVLADNQNPAHFEFDFLISIYTNPDVQTFEWSWIWTQVVTYVKIDGDTAPIASKLNEIVDKYAISAFRRLGIELDEFEAEKGEITFYLQPVKDIHLYSRNINNRLGQDGDILYVKVLTIIGVVILLLAIINFINLTTARAVFRAKEMGIKKVLGSSKLQLVFQLLTESLIISALAAFLGLCLSELLEISVLSWMEIDLIISPTLIDGLLLVMGFSISLTLLAGIYPALVLAQYKPVEVLKGQKSSGKGGMAFRNLLVVFQFAIAGGLIICTIIIQQQLSFFQNGNLGFRRDNVIVIEEIENLGEQWQSFEQQVKQVVGVAEVIVTSVVPGLGNPEDLLFKQGQPDQKLSMGTIKVNEAYISGLGLKLLAGRTFDKKNDDKHNVVLNKMAAKAFGWSPEEAIGKKIVYYEPEFTVIGVVDNYHTLPLYYEIAPLVLFDLEAPIFGLNRNLLAMVDGAKSNEVVADISSIWQAISTDKAFAYSFLDQELAKFYQNEEKVSKLFLLFTTLSLIIAGIGLFGITAFVAAKREKELGIRKVLGATIMQILVLVSTRFTKLVVLAICLGAPLAYIAMQQWLNNFVNHINIQPSVFIVSFIFLIVFTLFIGTYHALRSALANPVDSLRDE